MFSFLLDLVKGMGAISSVRPHVSKGGLHETRPNFCRANKSR
jgi:hypothetical protein